MAPFFPTTAILQDAFSKQTPFARSRPTPPTALESSHVPPIRRFSAWSAVEDVKSKAGALSSEAQNEIAKASSAARAKTGQIELYSAKYYAACTFGGLMACGVTHTAVTPLDLVKCRRQVDSKMYKGNFEAWGKIGRAEGMRGIFTGWAPTFFGYSAQGAFKYGGYEFFKKFYSDLAGEDAAYRYKTALYLTASASAELIADVALCPFEAVKVRMQTTIPPFASSTFGGISTITGKEGTAGLYKGLYPLWGRQIPYTMMKFASFETIVEAIYGRMPKSKSEYGKGVQTGVSFAGGYLAGILCAIVSHPADVMVSKLNANRQPGEAFGPATSRIYKDIGFGGLWNGLVIRIFMIGTLTSLQWGIYDSFKVFMGLPTTGGAAPPPKQTANLYVDGSIVREGPLGDQGDGPYSAGRGGAGNIESPHVKPTNVGNQKGDTDVIPETALREPGAGYENYHTGRGGAANVHKDNHEESAEHKEGLVDKIKHKIGGK
ncbi:MAG: hypothetical protein Q9226_000778 [Calogaya cf. arnoldii]